MYTFGDQSACCLDGVHIFLALARAALLGVGCQGGFSSLNFPTMTFMVGIYPSGDFIRCSSFVDFLCCFYTIKHLASIIVGLPFEIMYLYIGLLCPDIRIGV